MKDFKIINASRRILPGSKVTVSQKFSENEYYLMYITSGKAKLLLNGELLRIAQGDFLICSSGDTLKYRFAKSCDAAFSFVEFESCNSLENVFELQSGIYRCLDTEAANAAFLNLIREFIIKAPLSEINLSALLANLLCVLSRSRTEKSSAEEAIYALAEDINKNFLKGNIDVNKYAEKVGVSKDRLSVIFRQHFGYAPYKYQIMLKMNEATFLLRHTDLSVCEISKRLGFSSQLYFSSAYKKQMGCPPTSIRNKD